MTEQIGPGSVAPKVYVFDEQVCADDYIVPAKDLITAASSPIPRTRPEAIGAPRARPALEFA